MFFVFGDTCLILESYPLTYGGMHCGIPRLNASQWNTLDLFGRWLVAIRAAVLLMTAFAVCVYLWYICLSTRQIRSSSFFAGFDRPFKCSRHK